MAGREPPPEDAGRYLTSSAGTANHNDHLAHDPSESRLSRTLRIALIVIAAVLVALLALAFIRNKDWTASEHAKNYRELDIVGRTIESWPQTVEGMARTNFLSDRVTVSPDPAVRDRGYWLSTEIIHPTLGSINIGYQLKNAVYCHSFTGNSIDGDGAYDRYPDDRDRRLRYFKSRYNFRTVGELPLADLYYADRALAEPLSATLSPDYPDIWELMPIAYRANALVRKNMDTYAKGLVGLRDGEEIDWSNFKKMKFNGEDNYNSRFYYNPKCIVVATTSELPIKTIAQTESNAPSLDAVLLLDKDGKVIAPIGGQSLPILDLKDILPVESENIKTLTSAIASMSGKSNGASAEDLRSEAERLRLQAVRAGKPLPVVVSGEDYVAYFRPMLFNAGWDMANSDRGVSFACHGKDVAESRTTSNVDTTDAADPTSATAAAKAEAAAAKADVAQSAATKAAAAAADAANRTSTLPALGNACMLVGLVRAQKVEAHALSLSADVVMLSVLVLTIAILLVPATKLRFLGPAGDMRPSEVAVAIFGLTAAVALATLVVLMSWQMNLAHARARSALQASALQLATDFGLERDEALGRPLDFPKLAMEEQERPVDAQGVKSTGSLVAVPWPSSLTIEPLHCTFPDGTPTGARSIEGFAPPEYLELLDRPAMDDANVSRHLYWPARESIALMGPLGRAFPHFSALVNRCHAAGRASIAERPYFLRAMAGESDGKLPPQACSHHSHLKFRPVYTIEAIRSYSDGVPKIAAAVPFVIDDHPSFDAIPTCAGELLDWSTDEDTEGGPRSGIALVVFFSRALTAPVLPDGQAFVVVDASNHRLPYLFGSLPNRIGVENLADELGGNDASAAIAEARGSTEPRVFTALMSGELQLVAALRLKGTPWVVLVHQPVAEIDRPVASMALFAATAWLGIAMFASVALVLLSRVVRRGSVWMWLWPDPGRAFQAKLATLATFAIAVFLAVVIVCVYVWMPPLRPWLFWIGIIAPVLALWISFAILRASSAWLDAHIVPAWARRWLSPDSLPVEVTGRARRVLSPDDEWSNAWLFAALLFAIGAVPMAAFWADARNTIEMHEIDAEIVHYADGWGKYRNAIDQQMKAFGLVTYRPAGNVLHNAGLTWAGVLNFQTTGDNSGSSNGKTATRVRVPTGRTEVLGEQSGRFGPPSLDRLQCPTAAKGKDDVAGSGAPARFCVTGDPNSPSGIAIGLVEPLELANVDWGFRDIAWPWAIAGLLGVGALFALLYGTKRAVERGLFGFGTPLEAVAYPKIARKSPNGPLDIAPRSVILNGQAGILQELSEDGMLLDVGKPEQAGSFQFDAPIDQCIGTIEGGGKVVVIGLDLALKDANLRYRALENLERLSDLVETREQKRDPQPGRLVVLTDLSPLDRILQAYEREQSGSDARTQISRTEQLRWSRLFEEFTTYPLELLPRFCWDDALRDKVKAQLETEMPTQVEGAPPPPASPDPLIAAIERARTNMNERARTVMNLSPSMVDGILRLIDEVRFLPESVIESLPPLESVAWEKHAAGGYPIEVASYDKEYLVPVLEWAILVAPVSEAAATDYLRGMLIEHYQHLWAASSLAERIILDNLARGRVVNIQAALAIRSLIRRGLVKLDPVPKLVNTSFAAFVRQAERPDAIAGWKRQAPKSVWDRFGRFVSVLLPLTTLALAGIASFAGVGVEKIFPLLLGVIPALFTTAGGKRG
jgi:hypothetical protein